MANRPVLSFLYPREVPDDTVARVRREVADVEICAVPYEEPTVLRNARRSGTVTPELLALAPALSDDDWRILERSYALVALDLPEGLLERATKLALVQTISSGTDHLDVDAFARRGVLLANGSGFNAVPIAEFVMGRLLQIWKDLREIERLQDERIWDKRFGRALAGCTLGVVGLGSIGRATARLARAFGMRVVANRRTAQPGDVDPDVDELFPSAALDEMLAACDVVVIASALTPETRLLFGEQRIRRMKPGAVLCNVARGGLVAEEAVIAALEDGHLGAAVLDVAQEEPLPPGDPLWSAPNCYLSPHSSASPEWSRRALAERTARNLARAIAGETLESLVTPPAG